MRDKQGRTRPRESPSLTLCQPLLAGERGRLPHPQVWGRPCPERGGGARKESKRPGQWDSSRPQPSPLNTDSRQSPSRRGWKRELGSTVFPQIRLAGPSGVLWCGSGADGDTHCRGPTAQGHAYTGRSESCQPTDCGHSTGATQRTPVWGWTHPRVPLSPAWGGGYREASVIRTRADRPEWLLGGSSQRPERHRSASS